MRVALLGLALVGCGVVHVGDEARSDGAVRAPSSDAATPSSDGTAPLALVTVEWPRECSDCADLVVQGVGGESPYTVEWGDGETEMQRRLCGDDLARAVTVVVTDATGARSVPHMQRLTLGDAPCPVDAGAPKAERLCLQNPSFEGTPGFNTGTPNTFAAAPWTVCRPSATNSPDIGNENIDQVIAAAVPRPTAGLTWLGLMEDEQVSQTLCRGVAGGTPLSFRIDLQRLSIPISAMPDAELAFLEIHGAVASDCTTTQRLWSSPPLTAAWSTHCVTVQSKDYFDSLVLVSRSDKSMPATTYVIADNIVTVESCPPNP